MRTKLLSVLLATTSVTAAFAADDCATQASTPDQIIQCMVADFNSRVSTVKASALDVYNKNQSLSSTAYELRQAHAAMFNLKAAYQLTPFAFTWAKGAGKDALNISKAIKEGNFNSIPALTTQYQKDRYALFDNSEVEYAAYDAVFAETELMAKVQGISKESKASRSANYAANMYIGYLAPAALINAYQFASVDAPKYINASLNAMTQGMCQSQVKSFQTDFAKLASTNQNVNLLIDAGAPGSVVKKAFADIHVNYVVDALNTTYAYATGYSPITKDQPYDVCDYNTFQASVQSGNVYAVQLNNTINNIISKSRSHVPAQNIYWALSAVSAAALDKVITKPDTAPVAGAATLPF